MKDIKLMISLFVTPILAKGILSANEVQRLFSNITSLIKINEGLNQELPLLQFYCIDTNIYRIGWKV